MSLTASVAAGRGEACTFENTLRVPLGKPSMAESSSETQGRWHLISGWQDPGLAMWKQGMGGLHI